MGLLADPEHYMETRYAIQKTLQEVLDLLPQLETEFQRVFKRRLSLLTEEYQTSDAEKILVAMGSISGTIKEVVDELRAQGEKVGLLRIISFRPFPKERIYKALEKGVKIGVIDRAISLGSAGPLYLEISSLLQEKGASKEVTGFIAGLGGRDIRPQTVKDIFRSLDEGAQAVRFIDLKKWYQEESPLMVMNLNLKEA
jgi:pyruvate ferredoxin oxidoreductase alpha subunit